MLLSDLLKQIWQHCCSHKLRVFLALIGLIWETVAVIVLIGLGQGFYNLNKNSLEKVTNGNVIVIPNTTSKAYAGLPAKRKIHISAEQTQQFSKLIPFTVIGVISPSKAGSINQYNPTQAFMPYTLYESIWGKTDISQLFFKPKNENRLNQVQKNIRQRLAAIYHFDPTDHNAIFIPNTNAIQFMIVFFRLLQLFLGFSGLLTLTVGGISVANILFLIVDQRRAEIGLRLAIGATQRNVLTHIMSESAVIVGVGGLIGFALSVTIIVLLQHMHLPAWLGQPVVVWWSILLTTAVLSVIALLAGYFPAKRAARFNPVNALASGKNK